jgi:hypothetical protein
MVVMRIIPAATILNADRAESVVNYSRK